MTGAVQIRKVVTLPLGTLGNVGATPATAPPITTGRCRRITFCLNPIYPMFCLTDTLIQPLQLLLMAELVTSRQDLTQTKARAVPRPTECYVGGPLLLIPGGCAAVAAARGGDVGKMKDARAFPVGTGSDSGVNTIRSRSIGAERLQPSADSRW